MSDKVKVDLSLHMAYRDFDLAVEPRGKDKFFYSISGGGLTSRITTSAPLESAQQAFDTAKMFVDEHL